MRRGTGWRKYENCILTFAAMAANVFFMALLFNFYYALNDDTLMHDIMSGIYTGTPDGHNMQTLYPLGALIALLYKICRPVPWYGLFLCLCQFGSLYLVGVRLCDMWDAAAALESRGRALAGKLLWLALLSLFLWSVWLSHLINVQYTITCAMLAAAAIFLFLTTPDGLTARQFIIKNIASVILALAAYALRTEMFLLAFPLVCLAGFYRLTAEKKIFDRINLIRYGAVLGSVLAGMLLLTAVDYAAYGSEEWRDFRRFFDARTTVYDYYTELINDDRYNEEVESLGVTPPQRLLLRRYDYGLDDTINTQLLVRLAEYTGTAPEMVRDYTAMAPEVLHNYLYRTTHGGVGGDMPYNAFMFWAYMAVLIAGMPVFGGSGKVSKRGGIEGLAAVLLRRYAFVWQLVLLVLVRSVLWLFILFRGRYPDRITHSLYLLEFAVLIALFAREICSLHDAGKRRIVLYGWVLLLAAAVTVGTVKEVPRMRADQEVRRQTNADWYAIDDYCREHSHNFYLEDIASVTDFSRYMFAPENGSGCANYDYMGGWLCKSPLYEEKLARFGIGSAAEALLERDDVYLIASRQECDGLIQAVADYYGGQGIEIQAGQVDAIGEQYCVLRFTRAERAIGTDGI